jgi:ArsR family transcriptional regulator
VGDLVEAVGVSQPTVSKHLKVLRDAGLAQTRVQGQRRFYRMTAEPLHEVADFVGGLLPAPGDADGGPATRADAEASGTDLDPAEAAQQGRRAHGVGRTVEQVTERAQGFLDRFARQRPRRRGR